VQAMCVGDGNFVFRRPDGTLLQAGDSLTHPDHARAYDLLAADPEAFYHGPYAEALVAAVADGGALSMADLESYRVIETEPRSIAFHDYTVHARGDDLDDVLGTLSAVAHGVEADPLTEPDAALLLVDALRSPS
ncbi:gamma-glutamyltransferase, partial [Bradyrhizobium cajani]